MTSEDRPFKLVNLTAEVLLIRTEREVVTLPPRLKNGRPHPADVARDGTVEEQNVAGIPCPVIYPQGGTWVRYLPDPEPGVRFIVTADVMAVPEVARRHDVFTPALEREHGAVYMRDGRLACVRKLRASAR